MFVALILRFSNRLDCRFWVISVNGFLEFLTIATDTEADLESIGGGLVVVKCCKGGLDFGSLGACCDETVWRLESVKVDLGVQLGMKIN